MVKQTLPVAIGAAAVLLSACNSTDGLYSQGPWGPAHVHRSYPRYSSPWQAPLPRPAEPILAPVTETIIVAEPPLPSEVHIVEIQGRVAAFPTERELPPPVIISNPPMPVALHQAEPVQPAPSSIAASPPGVFSEPKRASSFAGSWKAYGPQGGACTIKLSSVPALDLYKAAGSGCQGKELQSINAWTLREGTVVLFSRGEVVARLSGQEAELKGTISGSGAPLRMSR